MLCIEEIAAQIVPRGRARTLFVPLWDGDFGIASSMLDILKRFVIPLTLDHSGSDHLGCHAVLQKQTSVLFIVYGQRGA